MLFDFLRKRGKEEEILEEIKNIKKRMNSIDSDVGSVFSFLNNLGPTVSDLQGKLAEIYAVTRLTLQNYDVLKEHSAKLATLEEMAKSHIERETKLEQTLGQTLKTTIPTPPQEHFSDTSLNSVNTSVKSLKSTEVGPERGFGRIFELEELTDMEKKAFAMLVSLIGESKAKEVRYLDLVSELYPHIPVEKRRSTVSNFLRTLEKAGLVKRERRGRHKVVLLTPAGIEAIGKENFKKIQKALAKEE